MTLFLGLDLSTQQIKGVVIDNSGSVVSEAHVLYDTELPNFKTSNGRIVKNGNRVTSPVLMWVDALELLLFKLKEKLGSKTSSIRAIGGAAQQHGSVYWRNLESVHLSSELSLSEQLSNQNVFTILDSPTWEDSSTAEYCEIQTALHTFQKIATITGSVSTERFTGNQIAKIKAEYESDYKNTERISLVSSFLASILLGKYAPIEVSDASGMNLLDVQTRKWSKSLCDDELLSKLGPDPVFFGENLGYLNNYFVEKFGFNKECLVCSMTGDNPGNLSFIDSLSKRTISEEKDNSDKLTIVISLGTSDTAIFPINNYPYSLEDHLTSANDYHGSILSHPKLPNKWAVLLCYKNGSLAREFVCDRLNNHSSESTLEDSKWVRFDTAYNSTPISNDEFGFYYILQEIIPKVSGIHKFSRVISENVPVTDDIISLGSPSSKFKHKIINESSISDSDARLIVKSQIMSMKLDCLRKGLDIESDIGKLVITGGASKNDLIMQTIADVFNLPVYTIDDMKTSDSNSASVEISSLSMPAMAGAISASLIHFKSQLNCSSQSDSINPSYTLKLSKTPIDQNSRNYNDQMKDFSLLRDHLESLS
ncbi:Xylulose kinase [Smittium culicis]|uniref:Xylulose kinase n=1 Tax=Smittium culicis TaxID=133412 RepID=A0A1R1XGM7_9FUNG|nr:Xylulose kinase [Smittium culicis]OMJ14635.1 Xylulose kinase [Smittium culicis]OMJ16965.1 Xylulose kinase [Smittium culicis]